jgi:methylamine utilization protein MauJ
MSQLFGEMKPVYAMYREAKNTDSDFYKFLCCYKIMEGLLGKMLANAFARAKTAGGEHKNGARPRAQRRAFDARNQTARRQAHEGIL